MSERKRKRDEDRGAFARPVLELNASAFEIALAVNGALCFGLRCEGEGWGKGEGGLKAFLTRLLVSNKFCPVESIHKKTLENPSSQIGSSDYSKRPAHRRNHPVRKRADVLPNYANELACNCGDANQPIAYVE